MGKNTLPLECYSLPWWIVRAIDALWLRCYGAKGAPGVWGNMVRGKRFLLQVLLELLLDPICTLFKIDG